MKFTNTTYFSDLEINIKYKGKNLNFSQMINKAINDRNFDFNLTMDNQSYDGHSSHGADALWFPLSDDLGLKLVAENDKYQTLEQSFNTVKKIVELQEKTDTIFPRIKNYSIETDSLSGTNYLIIVMQNMGNSHKNISAPSYIPTYDKENVVDLLQRDPKDTSKILDNLTYLKLCPEDEWYKPINLISGKIVDFHRFTVMPNRYLLPANNITSDELNNIYGDIIERYSSVLDEHGQPKWKGKIYQGFNFDNNYSMNGYSSDGNIYDSYFKLPFIPLNKVKDKKVLDIGSNQGFFCFQAAIHGASNVTGIEFTKEDVLAAEDIKEIMNLDNVEFINGDGVEYLMTNQHKYGLVIMNSVLHQIFPNLTNADDFMNKLSQSTEYLAFETPLNHPKMNISVTKVQTFLSKYFKIVRLINIYDAYSSGYRANFVCYN